MKGRLRFVLGVACCALVGLTGGVSTGVLPSVPPEVAELLPHAVLLWETAELRVPGRATMGFLASADVEGDGLKDLVCSTSVGLVVFVGDGAGQFALRPCDFYEAREVYLGQGSYQVDAVATMIALAAALVDLDGDGMLDAVVSTAGKQSPDGAYAYWLYSFVNRDGCFKRKQVLKLPFPLHFLAEYPLKNGTFGLLGVDVQKNESTVVLLSRDGEFSFRGPVVLATGRGWPVYWGDVTGDGQRDLVLQHRVGITLLPGNVDDGFGTARDFSPTGETVRDAALGDLTGDGRPELLVLTGAGELVVAQWNGDSFQELVHQELGTWYDPGEVVLADFTGDGLLDALLFGSSGRLFTVLPGRGEGLFYTMGSEFFWVDVVSAWKHVFDLDSDGLADLLLASPHAIHVLRNGGEPRGTSQLPVAEVLAAGDLTGDGIAELVVRAGRGVDVLWNDGNGGMIRSELTRFPTPGPNATLVERGGESVETVVEGHREVWLQSLSPVAAHAARGLVFVLLERTEVSAWMEKRVVYELRWAGLDGREVGSLRLEPGEMKPVLAGGDLDGDGNVDILMLRGGEVLVHWGGTSGVSAYPLPGEPYLLAIGDVTGDGVDDAIVVGVDQDAHVVCVSFPNRTAVISEPLMVFDLFLVPLSVASGDFDNDGILDVAVAAARLRVDVALEQVVVAGAEVWIHSSGHGVTTSAIPGWPEGDAPWPVTGLVAGDVTGDGHVDLAFTTVGGSGVFLLPGQGDGSFSSPRRFWLPGGSLFSADLDGNGQRELIANRLGGNPATWILWNGGGR